MSRRILVVEDNEDMRLLYKRLFRNENEWEFSEADSGESAKEIIAAVNPDLLIVDISLPGISGLDLTRKVRADYSSLKILIVTGHEVERYHDEAIAAGADDLVSKEIGKELVLKCREMLGLE